MEDYSQASFGFIGSRTFDKKSFTVEDFQNNQRFRIYRRIVEQKIGFKVFAHYVYEAISGYLLINRLTNQNLDNREKAIIKMVEETYQNLPDL